MIDKHALMLGALALFGVAIPARAQDESAPYAGLETREIKALSAEEVKGLLSAEGMGYALAAELNHYPGPRHVLALADSLRLDPGQRAEVETIEARMRERALALGRRIVDAETDLDSLFATGGIDRETLEGKTAEIARLEGELRAAHLSAHIETREVLTDEQVAAYDRLRGYESGHEGAGHVAGHRPTERDP